MCIGAKTPTTSNDWNLFDHKSIHYGGQNCGIFAIILSVLHIWRMSGRYFPIPRDLAQVDDGLVGYYDQLRPQDAKFLVNQGANQEQTGASGEIRVVFGLCLCLG